MNSEAVHRAPGHDHADHDRHRVLRRGGLPRAAGQRSAERRFSDHPGDRRAARRQPRDDGVGGGAAAREAVRHHRRRDLDQFDQLPGQHVDHRAVRSRPQHRRGRAGRAGDDRQGGAPAAAADAGAAVAAEGQPGRPAGADSRHGLADPADVGRRASTRRPWRSGSRWSAASPRSGFGGDQKYAVRIDVDPSQLAARGIGIDEVATVGRQRQRQHPDRNALRLRADLHRPGRRTAARGRRLCADRHRLSSGPSGSPRAGGARLRRRRKRQDGWLEPGRRPAADAHDGAHHPEAARAPTPSPWSMRSKRCCRRSARSCRRW